MSAAEAPAGGWGPPLQGRVALVVGGAQGIGEVLAGVFARAGATVCVADLQEERARGVTSALVTAGASAFAAALDLRREEQIQSVLAEAAGRAGGLDVVVHSAAPSRAGRRQFPENLARWQDDLDVLLTSPALLARHALPFLGRSPNGSLITISSVLAWSVSQESAAYHAGKAGLIQLTRYLAHQLGPAGVRVNSVCPGIVDREGGPRLSDDPINARVIQQAVPLRRAGRGEDIAQAALFLASDAARYVTGHTLVVDGGLSLNEPFGVGRRALQSQEQALDQAR